MRGDLRKFATRAEAAEFAGALISGALETAVADKGRASLFVSGGSTPGPLFDLLSEADLPWTNVTLGLVDERWVAPEDPASNERLVRARLLKGRAGAAGFLPMRTIEESADVAARGRNLAYAPHCDPADIVLLGMGNDGHTASWFPGSSGLLYALSPEQDESVVAIDATGCPVAGENVHRLTLTGPAVARARQAVMLLFGNDKLDVLERALSSDPTDMPVRHAIDKLGPCLTVVWAP
ncbi:MAG: 6-phosphogluconolactonase [Hyphomonas sp.]|nr:6-phosphogluconolactonase [Hyphomonas sp.]